MGLRRTHHSVDQSHRPVHIVGTTPAVDVQVPSSSAWYGRGHPGGRDVLECHFFLSEGVVHQHGATGGGPKSGEAFRVVLPAQADKCWGRIRR